MHRSAYDCVSAFQNFIDLLGLLTKYCAELSDYSHPSTVHISAVEIKFFTVTAAIDQDGSFRFFSSGYAGSSHDASVMRYTDIAQKG